MRVRTHPLAPFVILGLSLAWWSWNQFLPAVYRWDDEQTSRLALVLSVEASIAASFILELGMLWQRRLEEMLGELKAEVVDLRSLVAELRQTAAEIREEQADLGEEVETIEAEIADLSETLEGANENSEHA